ncbi:hypothetical protein HDU76_011351, partial [Blyttiomyces sp. JEL0837]
LDNPVYADTLFIVTFDESATYLGNPIYTVLLGKGIVGAGKVDNTKYDHYSVLATIEKNFNLGNLGASDASATPIPFVTRPCTKQNIKNVVAVAFENNSFDRVFGFWARTRNGTVNGTPQGASNYCPQNGQTLFVQPNLPLDRAAGPDHSVDGTTTEIYGPGVTTMGTDGHVADMSGFCAAYPESTDPTYLHTVIDGFDPSKVPIFTTLAENYAVFDRWFAAVPGPTIPNRLFLMSGTSHTSKGEVELSDPVSEDINGYPAKSIFRNLDESSISWKNYFSYIPTSIILSDT